MNTDKEKPPSPVIAVIPVMLCDAAAWVVPGRWAG